MSKHAAMISQKYALQFAPESLWHAHNFQLSQDSVDTYRLLDSFVSTPSRYVEEMASRIMMTEAGTNEELLLFNPYLSLDEHELRTVVSHADRLSGLQRPVVFSAKNGVPLAYYLSTGICDNSRYLMLLSCVNAAIDAKLLQAAYFVSCEVIKLPLAGYMSSTRLNGFLGGIYSEPMVWCAEAAVSTINAVTANVATPMPEILELRAARNRLNLYAYQPYHAGDVLFMSIASQRTESLCDGVVIHHCYAGIARRAECNLPILEIDGPILKRDGCSKEEPEYFKDVRSTLPTSELYVYCRSIRNYNITNFHLIDHIAFSLGKRYLSSAELYHQPDRCPPVGEAGLNVGGRPARVLLHFDAGWSLKIYPQTQQRNLVSNLLLNGYEVTILDGKQIIDGCRAVKFQGLESLEREMLEHDIVVGMDSFPAHFSSLVLKMPTICLFSCTHPINSCSSMTPNYVWLSNDFDCSPCQRQNHCFRYGGADCRNFSSPGSVVNAIDKFIKMRRTVAEEKYMPAENAIGLPQRIFRHLPSEKAPRFLGDSRLTSIFIGNCTRVSYSPTLLTVMDYAIRTTAIFLLIAAVFRRIYKYFDTVRYNGFMEANRQTYAYKYFDMIKHDGFIEANRQTYAYFRRLIFRSN